MNNRALWILVLMVMLVGVSKGQSGSDTDSLQTTFAAGGSVHLRLSSGDYTIRAGSSDRIRVAWSSKRRDDIRKVAQIRTSGISATVRTNGPSNDGHFVIELPSRSDIRINIRAGDVRITGIEGNKDVRMTAGDLDIDIGSGSYSRIQASTTFGDLEARPLRIAKGGIARSFDWTGPGQYELRAHLFAGDLKLSRQQAQPER
jgi:hypothetical protein